MNAQSLILGIILLTESLIILYLLKLLHEPYDNRNGSDSYLRHFNLLLRKEKKEKPRAKRATKASRVSRRRPQ